MKLEMIQKIFMMMMMKWLQKWSIWNENNNIDEELWRDGEVSKKKKLKKIKKKHDEDDEYNDDTRNL